MKRIEAALQANSHLMGYKINVHKKESYELFFVKGKLETYRRTDTCDKEVTVYVAHDEFLGDAQFFVYPYTTDEQLNNSIEEAISKAKLINNPTYNLPPKEEGSYEVESNFPVYEPEELAALISKTVFEANTLENASLNAVEVFINKHTETVANSNGLNKTQVRYNAMVEAIPTYNGQEQSVELYEQYNFSQFSPEALHHEIAGMMDAVKARYEAVKPDFPMDYKIILNPLELSQLFDMLVDNMRYVTVFSHNGMYHKGDMMQKAPVGDLLTIKMAGQAPGNASSSRFDKDGLTLGECTLVENGKVINYYGSNRYGQLLGEVPTGSMECLCVAPGSIPVDAMQEGRYLEVISMSGIQADCFTDYIGGEVRLAYYHDGEKTIPVTGISFSGSLEAALNTIRLSNNLVTHDSYLGPEKAVLEQMKIY